jgi:uncharacterized protein (TIGR03437 family)
VPPACSTRFENGELITNMAGAQVTFDGIPAPIFFALPGQLGVQVPAEISGGSATVEVNVSSKGQSSIMVPLDTASPGIFTVSMSGKGAGAITDLAAVLLSSDHSAHPGDIVVIYATGFGPLSPSVPTGMLPVTISRAVALVTVTIAGMTVVPDFAGQSGCCVGLNQVNVRIPASIPNGTDVPLFLTVGGKVSNIVTLPVQ